MAEADVTAYDGEAALAQRLWLARSIQVPVQLPIQLRITPDPDTVLWLDGFRRWRGALSFSSCAVTRRRDRSLWFAGADPSPWSDEEPADHEIAPRLRIDVVASVDGSESRSSRGEMVAGHASNAHGRTEASWVLPVPDDVADLRIRLECEELGLRRILELDTDLLRTALDDVWEMG